MTEFTFDQTSHVYKLDGKILPSVTQILKKAGLTTDFSMVNPEVLENKRQIGIDVHELTQLIDMGVEVEQVGYALSYMQFKKDTGFVPVEIELAVYSKLHGYAGTVDRVGLIKDKLSIVDLKTSATLDMLYMGPQTAAYEILYREWSGYKKTMPRYILQLKPDGYKLVPCKDKEDTNIFLYANQILRWRNKK
ncbi:MAG TPA: PD-(D/E)XK nuclease family protein [Desulfosporosinus sp.]|nr:PD-(D/E)XK nuclease family protein [Desulfosporosinus sp.]